MRIAELPMDWLDKSFDQFDGGIPLLLALLSQHTFQNGEDNLRIFNAEFTVRGTVTK
jgi:hypothetical protein